MHKKFMLIFALLLSLSFLAAMVEGSPFNPHQPPLGAVYGSPPVIDGTINVQEWSDATSSSFNNTGVFVKQDGENLYVALNTTNAPLMRIEEDVAQILFDVDFDRNLTLQADDVGFGVYRNGTLVEDNVTGGTWTLREASGWTAAVNSTLDGWQAEFNITYSKVNVVAGVYKEIGASIGIALYREEGSPTWVCWPPNTFSDMTWNPASWGAITSTGYNWTLERLPGVSPGQFVHYEVYSVWDGGNDTELESWARDQPMSGINVTVLSVVNATVTYEVVGYNSTGITYDSTYDVDVETGGYSYEYFFIAANLTAGDVIYTRDNNTWINETAEAGYLNQQLETNRLSILTEHSGTYFSGLPYSFSATASEDYYWHKQSGMLLELEFEFNTSRVSGMDVLVGRFVLSAVTALSNPPVIPEFPSFPVLTLIFTATLVAVIIHRRKHV